MAAHLAFNRDLPHLWPWAGWYVIHAGDRLVGVFPTLQQAETVALFTKGTGAVITKIGGFRAIAALPVDGGVIRP